MQIFVILAPFVWQDHVINSLFLIVPPIKLTARNRYRVQVLVVHLTHFVQLSSKIPIFHWKQKGLSWEEEERIKKKFVPSNYKQPLLLTLVFLKFWMVSMVLTKIIYRPLNYFISEFKIKLLAVSNEKITLLLDHVLLEFEPN